MISRKYKNDRKFEIKCLVNSRNFSDMPSFLDIQNSDLSRTFRSFDIMGILWHFPTLLWHFRQQVSNIVNFLYETVWKSGNKPELSTDNWSWFKSWQEYQVPPDRQSSNQVTWIRISDDNYWSIQNDKS